MSQTAVLCISLTILLTIVISSITLQEITYHFVEENRKGLILGNLNHFIKTKLKTDEKNIEFLISSNFFEIDNETKNVLVKVTVDLDSLCSRESVCCNEEKCTIVSKVVIQQNRQYSGTFLLKVEVRDVNDNPPVFLEPQQMIRISESILVNTSIPIESAIDKDFSKFYQKKVYELVDESGTFALNVQQHNPDILHIIVLKTLDFENKQSYVCHLRACDSIFQNCARKSILVEVIDENDNNPVFVVREYSKVIPENFPIGKEILRVHAVDIDGERYNRTHYGFVTSYDVNDVFFLDKFLGILSLRKKLSANIKDKYTIKVFAIDSLSVNYKKDFADVRIEVEDINDNEPLISLLQGPMPDFYTVNVEENTQPRALFSIQVSDKDKGENGHVNCTMDTQKSDLLTLKLIDTDIYQVRSLAFFDYERIQAILGQIICADSGKPQLVSRKGFRVIVKDVNEFPPEFKQNKVEIYLNENVPEGKTVLTIEASDKDRGAVLMYRLDDIGGIYFKVNSRTGEISTAKVTLDRETRDKVRFSVFVTDSIENPKTATATVTVLIIDLNDNTPKFVTTHPFMIAENQFVYTKLSTKIEATDNDVEENNRSIMFRLIHTFNSKLELVHDQIFDVNGKGEIETMSIIDREKDNNFTLTILAQDRGIPPLSSSVNITITIIDINDNSPIWIYPDSRFSFEPEAMMNVSRNVDVGFVIAMVKAVDLDSDDAGRVGYILLSTDRYSVDRSVFKLNKSSGALTVAQSPLSFGTSHLRIRAHDFGQPQMFRDATLILNVVHSNDTIFSSLNMVIIIGMLAITATISIFLIVAIIFIRRSPSPPIQVTGNGSMDDKINRENLEISCQNLFEQNPDKKTVFSDSDGQQYGWGSADVASNLMMYPQNSLDRGCMTYVRFANPGLFCQEIDGESADSGKGTSDIDMNLQSTMKGQSMNPYNHIQLIPSSKAAFLGSNNYLRRSVQMLNESDRYNTLSSPMLQQFAQHQTTMVSTNIPKTDLHCKISSYQEIPFNTLPPYRS